MKRGMVIGIVLVTVCIVAVLLAMRFLRRPVAETPVTPPPVAASSSAPAPASSVAASSAAAAEEQREGTPPKTAGTIPGFCCNRSAGTCVPSKGAATCLHEERGLVFDVREEKCNEICMFLLLR